MQGCGKDGVLVMLSLGGNRELFSFYVLEFLATLEETSWLSVKPWCVEEL